MVTLLYYLLKVVICSGILYGYYRLALHNKVFHHWNRFYLLFSVILSLTLPLIRINILHQPGRDDSRVIHLLTAVSSGDEIVSEASRNSGFQVSSEQLLAMGYGIVCFIFIILFCHTLWTVYKLASKNHTQKIHEINFVNTEAKGTPFSFFNYIFWNRNIEINSETGQQIFRHELAHVRERHSWDKLFLNLVLLFFWSNPIFWLIRRELNMIHEFIADSKSLDQHDTAAFAAMILQSVYPRHQFNLNNYFFYSPIKRRLLMLTKMKNTRVNYFSRILVLPLLTLVFVAFTLKTKKAEITSTFYNPGPLSRTVTIIIDAGHGGDDYGARGANGAIEKDINLAIAKKVKELNRNDKIAILLTRDKDETMDVRQRQTYATSVGADAFVSLHVNTTSPQLKNETDSSGFVVYVSSKNKNIEASSAMLGGFFIDQMKDVYRTSSILRKRMEEGIWVLDAPGISYPSILIECGYLTNPVDTKFIMNEKNQEIIARKILASVEKYVSNAIPNSSVNYGTTTGADSVPAVWANKKIKFMDFTVDGNVIVTYNNGKQEFMSLSDAEKGGLVPHSLDQPTSMKGKPIIIIDKKVMPESFDLNQIKAEDILQIEVYKDGPATKQYGQRAKYGVIAITLKNPALNTANKTPKNVLYIVDGKEMYTDDPNSLFDPKDVVEVTVLKEADAINKFGVKGQNGVVIINTNGAPRKDNVTTIFPERSDDLYVGIDNPAHY
ncbi:MAG: hypothetical protein C5B52_10410 [Bacteroidetes bacterium]|nr:MAG: hypothetical protein C5B52_10410 [Bacteroidota bacterium]